MQPTKSGAATVTEQLDIKPFNTRYFARVPWVQSRREPISSNVSNQHGAAKDSSKLPPAPVVVGIKIGNNNSYPIRAAAPKPEGHYGKRAAITEVSKASIKNATDVLTEATDVELNSLITATYPTPPDDGGIVKAHLKSFRQKMERRFGKYSYFTAIEYQKRVRLSVNGIEVRSPHHHTGLGIDLAELGEVETLKRKSVSRRFPVFETVKWAQDEAFELWVETLGEENPRYNGVKLDWPGLSAEDETKMRKAYTEYNSGFTWEVMRDKDGAKKYLVKELSGLKGYQKQVPPGFTNPGRHFLYSRDMRRQDTGLVFMVSEEEIKELLKRSEWGKEWDHDFDKPLPKSLWNSAGHLAAELVKAGYEPIKGSLEALREYADLRMSTFAQQSDEYRKAAIVAYADQVGRIKEKWERTKRKLSYELYWEGIFATAPPG